MIDFVMKLCSRCKSNKPHDAFGKRKRSKDGLNVWCRQCFKDYRQENKEELSAKQKAWRAANPEKIKEWDKIYSRRKRLKQYGMTEEDYALMVEAQDGLCPICFQRPKDQLVVDHCHDTGAVRGLLCRLCNSSMGGFRDDPQLLRRAADYLERV